MHYQVRMWRSRNQGPHFHPKLQYLPLTESIFQNGSLPFNKFEFLVTWLFREVSSPYLLLAAHFNPTIRWKTRSFRLKWGGKAEPVGEVVPVRVQDDSNCALTKLTHMTHMRSSSQEKFKL